MSNAATSNDRGGATPAPANNDPSTAGAPTAAASISPEELEALRARVKDRDEIHNKYLRALADLDNNQKRARRERERDKEEVAREVVRDLLPVLDNLDLTLGAAKPSPEAAATTAEQRLETLVHALSLLHDQLIRVLAQRGAQPTGTKPGEPFDANQHEAVLAIPTPGLARDEVGAVMRQGYKVGTTLIRPASVQVRKAVPQAGGTKPESQQGA